MLQIVSLAAVAAWAMTAALAAGRPGGDCRGAAENRGGGERGGDQEIFHAAELIGSADRGRANLA